MSKESLLVTSAQRVGLRTMGRLIIEYDSDADEEIKIVMQQGTGAYDYSATLNHDDWSRLVAWVEWQRAEAVFQSH